MIPPILFLIITIGYLIMAGDNVGSVFVDVFSVYLPNGAQIFVSIADLFTVAAIIAFFLSVLIRSGWVNVVLYMVVGVFNLVMILSWEPASSAAFAMITFMMFLSLFIQFMKMEKRWTA